MENVSSDQVKRGRGRPRTFDPENEKLYERLGYFDRSKTRRSRLNIMWTIKALNRLWNHYGPDFEWMLEDREAFYKGTGRIKRQTILSELGRIQDEEKMLTITRQVCELKPNSGEAIAMIRRYRLGRSPEPSTINLTRGIVETIKAYIQTHPQTSVRQVLAALENAAECWSEDDEEEGAALLKPGRPHGADRRPAGRAGRAVHGAPDC